MKYMDWSSIRLGWGNPRILEDFKKKKQQKQFLEEQGGEKEGFGILHGNKNGDVFSFLLSYYFGRPFQGG